VWAALFVAYFRRSYLIRDSRKPGLTISSYNPKAALYDAFPQMQVLSRKANPTMESAEDIFMEPSSL
jgi:hypothetical protein